MQSITVCIRYLPVPKCREFRLSLLQSQALFLWRQSCCSLGQHSVISRGINSSIVDPGKFQNNVNIFNQKIRKNLTSRLALQLFQFAQTPGRNTSW
jgi:hypothetical protein